MECNKKNIEIALIEEFKYLADEIIVEKIGEFYQVLIGKDNITVTVNTKDSGWYPNFLVNVLKLIIGEEKFAGMSLANKLMMIKMIKQR